MTIEKVLDAVINNKMHEMEIAQILEKAIEKNIIDTFSEKSKFVKFSNGCSIYFDDDYWGGDTPYGVETSFNKNISEVLNWLKYWDDDRDEYGNLLSQY
jgi:hypothetical protein